MSYCSDCGCRNHILCELHILTVANTDPKVSKVECYKSQIIVVANSSVFWLLSFHSIHTVHVGEFAFDHLVTMSVCDVPQDSYHTSIPSACEDLYRP